MPRRPVLVLADVWKSYPGVQAVRSVDFTCEAGEIRGLVGENGAGKSTLMAIASGSVTADRGSVTICGEVLRSPDPRLARQLGLAMVYQDDSLAPDLNIAENLRLGATGDRRPTARALYDWAADQLGRFDSRIDPRAKVRDLSVMERQIVEIVKSLLSQPRILLLDEPTSALAGNEVVRLHDLLRRAAEAGTGIVYTTHRLHEVLAVADDVCVMRDGEMVKADIPVGATGEDELVSLMVGRPLRAAFPAKRRRQKMEPLLRVRELCGDGFEHVTFDGRKGEVVGLAGIEGNGQREFLRALAGLEPRTGDVILDGETVPSENVSLAQELGMSYMSADRRRESLFSGLSVRENMTVSSLSALSTIGIVPRSRERAVVANQVATLNLRTPGLEQPVSRLSGGNQQKVVLGRVLLTNPTIYLADEPTQGVDAGSRLEIYHLLRMAAGKGGLAVVLSSDAVELSGLCDRVLVFARGRVVRELTGVAVTEENIVAASVRSQVYRDNQQPSSVRVGEFWRRQRDSDLTPIVFMLLSILLLGLAVGTTQPLFLTGTNLGNLLFLAVPLGFATLGQAFVMLLGGIDLSIGPLVALVTVAVAQIMSPEGGLDNIGLSIAAGAGIGVTLGAVNATLVRRIRLNALIATLGTYIFVQGIALLWMPVPGGYVSIAFMDRASARLGYLPWAFVVLVIIAVAAEVVYRRSIVGLWFRTVGSRPSAAVRLGARGELIYYAAYCGAGLCGGMGGVFFAATIGIGDPTLGIVFTLGSITAVVLGGVSMFGGRGSFIGPLVAVVFLTTIDNSAGFLDLPIHTTLFTQGALTIGAIALYSRVRTKASTLEEGIAK